MEAQFQFFERISVGDYVFRLIETSEGFVAIIEKLDIPCRDPLCRIYARHYAIIARNVENMIDVYIANGKR